MRYPSRQQQKHTKKRYKVRNWREYDQALQRRGDLTLWFSEAGIRAWKARASGRPGGQRLYTQTAIEVALTVRMVYGLALRQTEGFLRSVCRMLDLNLPIPDHSTLSRRAVHLDKLRLGTLDLSGPIHLLVDSTGVRVHAGNSGKPPRNRGWRKLHLAVDARTGEVAAVELTGRRVHDSRTVPKLLRQVRRGLASFAADGAYDTEHVYEAVTAHARRLGRAVPRILMPAPQARPAGPNAHGRDEAAQSQPTVNTEARPKTMAQVVWLQPPQSGRNRSVPVQAHPGSCPASQEPGWSAGGGATRMSRPKQDDSARHARQRRHRVIGWDGGGRR